MIPRAVLFDAGNTLIHLDFPRMARAVGDELGRPLTGDALEALAPAAARAMERASATDQERATAFLEALFLAAGVPTEQMDAVRGCLYRLHQDRHLWSAVRPGTPEALDRLRQADIRLGVVSNSDGRVEAALAAAGLLDRFVVVVDSTLVGVEKPDPRIFEVALDHLGLPAAEAVYVGDLYEVDVVGARRAGIEPLLLDPSGGFAGGGVRTLSSIAELPELILAGPAPASPQPRPGPAPR